MLILIINIYLENSRNVCSPFVFLMINLKLQQNLKSCVSPLFYFSFVYLIEISCIILITHAKTSYRIVFQTVVHIVVDYIMHAIKKIVVNVIVATQILFFKLNFSFFV